MTNLGDRIHIGKGWVELQDVMGNDLAIVNAARTSYLGDSKGEDKDRNLLLYLARHKHDGPFEMAEMKFRIHAPEIVWRQLLRHRAGNFNLQSFRYTEAEADEFLVLAPDEWRLQSTTNKQGSEGALSFEEGQPLTDALLAHITLSMNLYEAALEKGVAREIARLYLPAFGLYSTGIIKFDVRNLMHFFSLRLSPHAQEETRRFAEAMHAFFADKFPICNEAFNLYKRGE